MAMTTTEMETETKMSNTIRVLLILATIACGALMAYIFLERQTQVDRAGAQLSAAAWLVHVFALFRMRRLDTDVWINCLCMILMSSIAWDHIMHKFF